MEVFSGSIALYNNFKSIVLICINKISTTSLVFNNDKLSAYKLFSEESLQETPSLNQLSTPKIFGVRTLKCHPGLRTKQTLQSGYIVIVWTN